MIKDFFAQGKILWDWLPQEAVMATDSDGLKAGLGMFVKVYQWLLLPMRVQ